MTLLDIARNNVTRAWRTYALHFVNSAFAVIAFFLFMCLAMHPEMGRVAMGSTIGIVSTSSGVVVGVFSLAFISYSESCFLRARSRQFGLLAMAGASKRQLRRIVFAENMIIGACAICTGALFGTAFLKLFLAAAGKAMGTVTFDFYLPVRPAAVTVLVFLVVFAVSGILGGRGQTGKEVGELLSMDRASEDSPSPKVAVLLVVASAALFAVGRMMAQGDSSLIWSFVFMFGGLGLLVSVTHLAFLCWFEFGLRRRKATGSYYEGLRMLKDGVFRRSLKGNLQSMTVTAVLCSLAFFSLVWVFALSDNAYEKTEQILPYSVTYIVWQSDAPVSEHEAILDSALAGEPGLKKASFAYSRVGESRSAVMSESSYNASVVASGREPVSLGSGEALLLPGTKDQEPEGVPESITEALGSLDVRRGTWLVLPDGCASSVTVLGDADYRSAGFDDAEREVLAYSYDGWENDASLSSKLAKVTQSAERREVSLFLARDYYESDRVQFSLLLYLGSILGVSFLLASASLAYSRLHARAFEEAARMRPVVKIGLSRSGLAKVCRSVSLRVLAVPLGVSLLYLWAGVALVVWFGHGEIVVPAIGFTLVALVVGATCCAAAAISYASSVTKTAFEERF